MNSELLILWSQKALYNASIEHLFILTFDGVYNYQKFKKALQELFLFKKLFWTFTEFFPISYF